MPLPTSIPIIYFDQRRGIYLADQRGRFRESLPGKHAPARPALKSTKSRPEALPPFPHATSRLTRAGTGRSAEDDIVGDSLERRPAAGSTKPRTISRIVPRLEIPRIIAPRLGDISRPDW